MAASKNPPNPLVALMPVQAKHLLRFKGSEFIEEFGDELIRQVVFNVLCGKNLRDSTELLTRKRLGLLNAATVAMFVRGGSQLENFSAKVPNLAARGLEGRNEKADRWIMQWMLGLNDKAVQNVLRDKADAVEEYAKQFANGINEVGKITTEMYGPLKGQLSLAQDACTVDWHWAVQLMAAIGAQTLAIRGSNKSAFGKLFERLILGSVLSMLEFKQIASQNHVTDPNRIFWLSSREDKRESDATALIEPGKGVRFDIGFIGRGNSEISLDKVSRFERSAEFSGAKYHVATFVIVDRIGAGSRIVELAKAIEGTIIQMSLSYWPYLVAKELQAKLGYASELAKLKENQVAEFIMAKLKSISFKPFIEGVEVDPEMDTETPS